MSPFTKQLFSSDAFGVAEFYYLGALLFRSAPLRQHVIGGSPTACATPGRPSGSPPDRRRQHPPHLSAAMTAASQRCWPRTNRRPSSCSIRTARRADPADLRSRQPAHAAPACASSASPSDDLSRHIAWDIGAADVTRHMALQLDAPAVLCGYSRLVVDCNRLLHDPTLMPAVSDGSAVPGNVDLVRADRQARLDAIYVPYHQAIEHRLDAMRRPSWRRGRAVDPQLHRPR